MHVRCTSCALTGEVEVESILLIPPLLLAHPSLDAELGAHLSSQRKRKPLPSRRTFSQVKAQWVTLSSNTFLTPVVSFLIPPLLPIPIPTCLFTNSPVLSSLNLRHPSSSLPPPTMTLTSLQTNTTPLTFSFLSGPCPCSWTLVTRDSSRPQVLIGLEPKEFRLLDQTI